MLVITELIYSRFFESSEGYKHIDILHCIHVLVYYTFPNTETSQKRLYAKEKPEPGCAPFSSFISGSISKTTSQWCRPTRQKARGNREKKNFKISNSLKPDTNKFPPNFDNFDITETPIRKILNGAQKK